MVKQIPIHGKPIYALVDDADYDMLKEHKWYCLQGYVRTTAVERYNWPSVLMHRMIMQTPLEQARLKGQTLVVYHLNRDLLDNRRCNLKLITKTRQGKCMTKKRWANGKADVFYNKRYDWWSVKLFYDGKRRGIGKYETREEAEAAYEIAVSTYGEEYARHREGTPRKGRRRKQSQSTTKSEEAKEWTTS
jgi:hypothetical protein